MEETTNVVVEAGKKINVNGNLPIVLGTAAGTIALYIGGKWVFKKVKTGIKNRKQKKEKIVEEAPAKNGKKEK